MLVIKLILIIITSIIILEDLIKEEKTIADWIVLIYLISVLCYILTN